MTSINAMISFKSYLMEGAMSQTAAVSQPTPSPAPQDTVQISWPSLIFVAVAIAAGLLLAGRYFNRVLGRD